MADKTTTVITPGPYHKSYTGMAEDPAGNRRWFINGVYGRENDLPSFEGIDGTLIWYTENPKRGGMGQKASLEHREGGPAYIKPDGSECWYQMGKLHREGGPARTKPDGSECWYQMGKLHREGGHARIKPDGSECWYRKGKLHRDDGLPAITLADGTKAYFEDGELQRWEPPAPKPRIKSDLELMDEEEANEESCKTTP